jgi:hypothetical protein
VLTRYYHPQRGIVYSNGIIDGTAQEMCLALIGENITAAEAAERMVEMSQQEEYVAAVRAANKQVWDGINNLVELQRQWNALDYGHTLTLTGYTAAEIGAVVFDTANAMVTVLGAGHATNMAKLL